jgi:UDP-N-acetylglucosamine 2-epimerase (non-hydrolysing)
VKKVMVVFGTRPEAIKLCPLVLSLRQQADRFHTLVCVTAQHREMLDQVLQVFGVVPDRDLDLMTPGQSLPDITARALQQTAAVIAAEQPDVVIVQGDTTTTFAASLAAYYQRTAVAHVEAGLRTGDKYAPFPEEICRKLTGAIADFHFAATQRSRDNLLAEGVRADRIVVTGNTVIDALLWVRDKARAATTPYPELRDVDLGKRLVLVTGHRRENFGARFVDICNALKSLAQRNPDIEIVYPVHRNPNVTSPVHRILSRIPNIKLIEPLSYEPFVYLMDKSHCIISDSGGVQEEAPSLGKPVLVTRDITERQEAVEAGVARLVGSDPDAIVAETESLLNDPGAYARFTRIDNPFGDGHASERIVEALARFLAATPAAPPAPGPR